MENGNNFWNYYINPYAPYQPSQYPPDQFSQNQTYQYPPCQISSFQYPTNYPSYQYSPIYYHPENGSGHFYPDHTTHIEGYSKEETCQEHIPDKTGHIEKSHLDDSDISEEDNTKFGIGYDYTKHFLTDKTFASLKELKDYLKATTISLGFLLTTTDSRNIKELLARKVVVTMKCVNHGDPQSKKNSTKDTGSGKCFCEFRLQCYKEIDCWKFSIQHGVYNHDMITYMEAHSQARKLNLSESSFVHNMYKSFVKPTGILKALKKFSPDNLSNRKDIYNIIAKDKLVEMRGRSEMQQLMHMLETKKYICVHRTNSVTDHLEDLFFMHEESLKLFRAFPHILCMDCTYSTNRFNLPFLQIVGVTSTQNTFCVCFALMRDEKQPTYEWALGCLRNVLKGHKLPRVVLTDRDKALMNAVGVIFPESIHLLCKWHICKNVQTYCSDKLPLEDRKLFKSDFFKLLDSETLTEYHVARMKMETDYQLFPNVMKYTRELLDQTQEKVVACWTNRSRHLGNRTTNRAEGQHHVLKNQLDSSGNKLDKLIMAIDGILAEQLNKIKQNLGKSKATPRNTYRIPLFKQLIGKCSANALELMWDEGVKSDVALSDQNCKSCEITMVYNLPCVHVILSYLQRNCPIPLDYIDEHWQKLDYEQSESRVGEANDFEEYMSNLRRLYETTTYLSAHPYLIAAYKLNILLKKWTAFG